MSSDTTTNPAVTSDFAVGGSPPLDAVTTREFSTVVLKEVDMGFTANPFYDKVSGCNNRGCQRVSYCSCNCNHCSLGILG